MLTFNDILFTCNLLVSSINMSEDQTYPIYLNDRIVQQAVSHTDQIRGCVEIAVKSKAVGFDPILSLAIGWNESFFRRGVVSGSNIGMMQVTPKYWCHLILNLPRWDSKNHHYLGYTCDLELAGVKAISQLRKQYKSLKETPHCEREYKDPIKKQTCVSLYLYNRGFTCRKEIDPIKKQTCIKAGENYADHVMAKVEHIKKVIKNKKYPPLTSSGEKIKLEYQVILNFLTLILNLPTY